MYWPVGPPNVFALSKHALPRAKFVESDDGVTDEQNGVHSPSSNEGTRDGITTDSSSNGHATTKGAGPEPDDVAAFEQSEILDAKISRGGSVFATITRSSLTMWQTKPTVALAGILRSPQSLQSYGPNTALLLRPDALLIVVQTALGYMIMYSLTTDPNARVYQSVLPDSGRHSRRNSGEGYNSYREPGLLGSGARAGAGEGDGIREVNIRFRMVIRIDAGISKALALEDELVVATQKPAAMQCIRWVSEDGASQTSTELLSKVLWIGKKTTVVDMVYDRPMNLTTWITNDGKVYAVQRRTPQTQDPGNPKSLFQGVCFHEPETDGEFASKVAINARFSVIAVGVANGNIDVYIVKDYAGNIPISHKLRSNIAPDTTGRLTCLSYSPDGYCLFAGYEKGWSLWSIYGKPGASSFGNDSSLSQANDEQWLHGILEGLWIGGGCELALLPKSENRLWFLDMARNAAVSCLMPANISRGLLHSSKSIMIYKGHDVTDMTSLPAEMSLWQTVPIPTTYLAQHWPIKVAAASPDGKYVAIAGRRGLAHYSVASGRWRTFDDPVNEGEFAVRGGMCWYQHILIAAIESNNRHQLRLFSRDKALDYSNVQHFERLGSPAISMAVSGVDSLLVYTYDNQLLHFVIVMGPSTSKLVQVGQIKFHGIIRAPPRVRAISWILPDDQLEHGDPSQDVARASVIFLVDGKLVLLQPSTNEQGELKYDMRVIAQNVEFYLLLRDQPSLVSTLKGPESQPSIPGSLGFNGHLGHSLRDSLWYFDGIGFNVWSDVQDVMACAPAELGRDLPVPVSVPVDFYPLSAVVSKGIIPGIDADLVQRRDANFSFFRIAPQTQLFLPQLLRQHLSEYNSPAALHLSSSYQRLPYFPHALEMLLHDVLDAEVDDPPSPPETALLPTILSFLSSFTSYLDVVVNCTRKTELRSWRTLFFYLPPVVDLFQQSLMRDKLSTAAGFLLVLHAFEEDSFQVIEFAGLLRRAVDEQDWELCKELARFLVGIDATGSTLRSVLTEAGLQQNTNEHDDTGIHSPIPGVSGGTGSGGRKSSAASNTGEMQRLTPTQGRGRTGQTNGPRPEGGVDYFSMR